MKEIRINKMFPTMFKFLTGKTPIDFYCCKKQDMSVIKELKDKYPVYIGTISKEEVTYNNDHSSIACSTSCVTRAVNDENEEIKMISKEEAKDGRLFLTYNISKTRQAIKIVKSLHADPRLRIRRKVVYPFGFNLYHYAKKGKVKIEDRDIKDIQEDIINTSAYREDKRIVHDSYQESVADVCNLYNNSPQKKLARKPR